jgi:hypothetical protein
MAEISLSVTKAILAHAQGVNAHARQIAFADATSDIAPHLARITKANRVKLRLGGLITLTLADSSSIWRAHNEQFTNDFDALYDFLARYPSKRMRFICHIIEE